MTVPSFGTIGTLVHGKSGAGASTFSVNVGFPASIAAGDTLIISAFGKGTTSLTDSFSPPSGFTQITNVGGGTVNYGFSYYKIATGSESGTVTVTVNVALTSGVITLAAQMARYTGSLTSGTPYEAAGTNSGSSTTAATASITTTGTDELGVALISSAVTTTVGTISGASWAVDATNNSGATDLITLSFQHDNIPTATTVASGNSTLGTTGAWKVITFALKSPVASNTPYDRQHSPSHQAQMAS